jgi:hypothetical protein
MSVGILTHPLVELRQRASLASPQRAQFDEAMHVWLQRAVAQTPQ